MPEDMSFEYKFLIHFIRTYKCDLSSLLVDDIYHHRSHAQKMFKIHKFKTARGPKSMLFTGVHLFDKHFKSSEFHSFTSGYVRGKFCGTSENCLLWGSSLLSFIVILLYLSLFLLWPPKL